jgi:heat shock protein HspQ
MDRTSFFSPQAGRRIDVPRAARARFAIGDVVCHREYDFRGVVFDIDPVFANSEAWYLSIPEDLRPDRDQPYYHLLAESEEESYIAYVSQQNLVRDIEGDPVHHPALDRLFERFEGNRYQLRAGLSH